MNKTIVVMLLLAPMTAAAQTAPTPTPTAAPEKKTCRSEASTGSILPGKRTCHTATEWKQIDNANQAAVDNFRNRAGSRTGSSSVQ